MSHTIELTDEQYTMLEAAAARGGETTQSLVERWVRALAESQNPIYYNEDDMFAALDAYAAESDQAKQRGHADADGYVAN